VAQCKGGTKESYLRPVLPGLRSVDAPAPAMVIDFRNTTLRVAVAPGVDNPSLAASLLVIAGAARWSRRGRLAGDPRKTQGERQDEQRQEKPIPRLFCHVSSPFYESLLSVDETN